MKQQFPDLVERGRMKTGPLASRRGDTWGFFVIRHPISMQIFKVQVGDGLGWDHVSVSKPNNKPPTWGDMCWVKSLFFDPEECAVQFHPRASEYVNHHPGCLHLWRPQGVELPTPDPIMVGPGRKVMTW